MVFVVDYFHWVLGTVALFGQFQVSAFPFHLQSLLQSIAGLSFISEEESAHLSVRRDRLAAEVLVISEFVLVVVHDRSVLLLIGFVQDDVHGLYDVVFHDV